MSISNKPILVNTRRQYLHYREVLPRSLQGYSDHEEEIRYQMAFNRVKPNYEESRGATNFVFQLSQDPSTVTSLPPWLHVIIVGIPCSLTTSSNNELLGIQGWLELCTSSGLGSGTTGTCKTDKKNSKLWLAHTLKKRNQYRDHRMMHSSIYSYMMKKPKEEHCGYS